jgi:hypothetical protein
MFDLSGAWYIYDKLNIVIFNPRAVFCVKPKEVKIWSERLNEFYVEHVVLYILYSIQPPVVIVLTGNI